MTLTDDSVSIDNIEDLLRDPGGLGKLGAALDKGSQTSSMTSSTSGSTISSFNPQPIATARHGSNVRSRRSTLECGGGEATNIGQALSKSAIAPAVQNVSSRPRPRRVKMHSMPAMSQDALDFFGVPDVIPTDKSIQKSASYDDEEKEGSDQEEKIVTIKVNFAGGKDPWRNEASDQQSQLPQALYTDESAAKPEVKPQCAKPSEKVESECQCIIL